MVNLSLQSLKKKAPVYPDPRMAHRGWTTTFVVSPWSARGVTNEVDAGTSRVFAAFSTPTARNSVGRMCNG